MNCAIHGWRCDNEVCRAQHERERRQEVRTGALLVLGIATLVVLLKLFHAYLFYGDLSCAFAECRKEIIDAR